MANALPLPDDPATDPQFELRIVRCAQCSLVQLGDALPAEAIFTESYPYFSSFSDSFVAHARGYVEASIAANKLGPDSFVVEIASNDGYLLKHFVERGIRVLGVDPSPGPAAAAVAVGVPTMVEFFGQTLAKSIRDEHGPADVIAANNVIAHVPDLNDVAAGLATLISDTGVITIENPYCRTLVDNLVFDTIYHEHYCYFSCTSISQLASQHGLFLNDAEFLPNIHGGSIRYSLQKFAARTDRCQAFLDDEQRIGMNGSAYYEDFAARVQNAGAELHSLLKELKAGGAKIAAYGAAAKGATLLNSQHIGLELIDYVVDLNPAKQGRAIPGCRIPIVTPDYLVSETPDYLVLLAWNYKDEIKRQQENFLAGGGQMIVPLPSPVIER